VTARLTGPIAVLAGVAAWALMTAPVSGTELRMCVDAAGNKTFSDRPCPSSQTDATPPTLRRAAKSAEPTPIRDAARYGLSYGLTRGVAGAGARTVEASCHAPPAPVDRPRGAGSCDPYVGDTACVRRLPLLCRRDAQAALGGLGNPAQLGAAPPVRGDAMSSEKAASGLCEAALGPGWRVARFHDEPSGWRQQAQRHASLGEAGEGRYWVAIGDQPGNCWDPPLSTGLR
jgi:hypothetical protein